MSVTVAPESSTTAITKVTAFDPATGNLSSTPYYGFNFVIDAQPYGNSASATKPNGVATGTITFNSGGTTLGSAAIASNGVAEIQSTTLAGGNDNLTAVFPGDASFQPSTSAPYPITVVPGVTGLVIAGIGSSATNAIGVSASLSVDSLGALPTGTVTFLNGSTTLGTAH